MKYKWKNFNIGQKMGTGFSVVIFLVAVIGITSIINMLRLKSDSQSLSSEFIPLSNNAQKIEQKWEEFEHFTHQYDITNDEYYYTRANNTLQQLNDFINEVITIANRSDKFEDEQQTFNDIREDIEEFRTIFEEYHELMDTTQSTYREYKRSLFQSSAQYEGITNALQNGTRANIYNSRSNDLQRFHSVFLKIDQLSTDIFLNVKERNVRGLGENLDILKEVRESINQLPSGFKATYSDFFNPLNQYMKVAEDYLDLYIKTRKSELERIELSQLIAGDIKVSSDVGSDQIVATSNNTKNIISSSINWFIILLVLILLIGGTFAYTFTRSISTPLVDIVKTANKIAEGYFNVSFEHDRADEIGRLKDALDNMKKNLKEAVENIKEGANIVDEQSKYITNTAESLSQSSNEQASSTEEVSTSVEQMLSSISNNSQNAKTTEEIASKAEKGIVGGKDVSEHTVKNMKEIANKITEINKIAERTDILAVNAEIEAARAGEYGKGFAVVANEVRELAERSQKTATEITNLTTESVKVAEQSGETIKEIVPDVQRTSKLVQEISAASQEQNSGANQISKAIEQLNQGIQQNTASAEELSTSAAELKARSNETIKSINFFKFDDTDAQQDKQQEELINKIDEMAKSAKDPEALRKVVEDYVKNKNEGAETESIESTNDEEDKKGKENSESRDKRKKTYNKGAENFNLNDDNMQSDNDFESY